MIDSQWRLMPAARHGPFAEALDSLDACRQQLSQVVSGSAEGSTCVYRVAIGDTAYYAKVYRDRRFRTSRGQREWDNLQLLSSVGVKVPTLLALGRWGDHGSRHTVLVTAEVPGACDLAACIKSMPERFAEPDWYDGLCRALAAQVRMMHDARFTHNDLNWRNILVVPGVLLPEVWVFDCPSGRRWVWPFLGFRIAKDLTHLDKMGRRHLRATQRWRFFKYYCRGLTKTREAKKLAWKVLARNVAAKYRPR